MASEQQLAAVGRVLVDPKFDLTQRFRALFTLRNLGGKTSTCGSPTFLCAVMAALSLFKRRITVEFLEDIYFGIHQVGIFPKCWSELNLTVGRRMFNVLRPQPWLRFNLCPGADAIEWIGKAFADQSALLKHELAYCLGQMQDTRAIPTLTAVLKDREQEAMVRHEAGMQTRYKCTQSHFLPTFLHPGWVSILSQKIFGHKPKKKSKST